MLPKYSLNGERKGKLDAYETGNYSVSEDFYQLEVYSCGVREKVKCEYSGSFPILRQLLFLWIWLRLKSNI